MAFSGEAGDTGIESRMFMAYRLTNLCIQYNLPNISKQISNSIRCGTTQTLVLQLSPTSYEES